MLIEDKSTNILLSSIYIVTIWIEFNIEEIYSKYQIFTYVIV